MFVLHLALGGCLAAPPVRYGITADTGGHIAYLLDAGRAQATHPGIERVSLVTRLFEDGRLGAAHALASEPLEPRIAIERIDSGNRAYLEKAALAADLPGFTRAFLDHLAALPRRPDVIHAHFADAAAVALAARARFGIPVVYTPHALGLDKQAHRPDDHGLDTRIEAERRAIGAVDAIVVSTADEADRQIAAYRAAKPRTRILCLPPGVPRHAPGGGTGPAMRWLARHLPDRGRPLVLAIARPVFKKNLAALVRAHAATPGLAERADLVILAGQHETTPASAEERAVLAELARLCADPALRGRVALPPAHDAADVAALYRRAAQGGVFVNPALHEPFGLTLIEAAAAGVPVVATRHGGPGEILEQVGHGMLVDPQDEAAIGAACLRILSDPVLHARLSRNGRMRVGHYDWHRYAEGSVALYRALQPVPRLLACDIDNTLTGCETGAAAFAAWRARSALPFVVATGRSFEAARAVLARWRLPMPDAFIVDVGTRIMLPGPDGAFHEDAAFAAGIDRDWNRGAVAAALAPLELAAQPPHTAGPHKLSFTGTAADAAAIRAQLAALELPARVVFSHDTLIDVLAPHAGKAAALAHHAARLGLALADCVAAGDSGNDRDMLDRCGVALVVANAEPELDDLRPRAGLLRLAGRHAAGVMEGLALLGLAAAGDVPSGHAQAA